MANIKLVNFIKEARRRGFDDFQIREPLLRHGWPDAEVEKAFIALKPKENSGDKKIITVYLDKKLLSTLEKRADKNMLNLHEQIEDILRRSALNMRKKTPAEEKVDDKFIAYFSRKK